MPITFHYDEKNAVLYETGWGHLTFEDFAEYFEAVADCDFPDEYRVLADYTTVDPTLFYKDLANISTTFQERVHRRRKVQVALCASTDLGFGLCRMFSTFIHTEMYNIRVFRTLAAGREWLGLPLAE
jgi:hypothetical protein